MEEEEALDIHRKAIVINSCDSTYAKKPSFMFSNEYSEQMKHAGVTCCIGTAAYHQSHNFRFTTAFIRDTYRYLRDSDVSLALSVNDIRKAKKEGRAVLMLGTQNSTPIDDDIGYLSILHKLGLREMGLVYNYRNFVGDGSLEKENSGISEFGVQVIEEMNRLGIVIDLTHVGVRSSLEAIDTSKQPCIFSHSNVRAICDHWRNITDEQIKAVAEKDGVVGIVAFPEIVKENATLEDFLTHIDHVARLVGVDHVGLGLDTSGDGKHPTEFPPRVPAALRKGRKPEPPLLVTTDIPKVTKGLVAREYSKDEVMKILGGNFLRVFEKVFKHM